MNKAELAASVSEKTGLAKKESEAVVNAVFEVMGQELAAGGKVQLLGFGTFEVRERAERTGRNPSTNEPMVIPASKNAVFKPGKSLKDALNRF